MSPYARTGGPEIWYTSGREKRVWSAATQVPQLVGNPGEPGVRQPALVAFTADGEHSESRLRHPRSMLMLGVTSSVDARPGADYEGYLPAGDYVEC